MRLLIPSLIVYQGCVAVTDNEMDDMMADDTTAHQQPRKQIGFLRN